MERERACARAAVCLLAAWVLAVTAQGTTAAFSAITSSSGNHVAAAGSFYREQVLADGAVGYWRLGEAAGTVAADEVGASSGVYEGVVNLGEPGVAQDGDTAAGFPPADHVILPRLVQDDFTIEFWFAAADGIGWGPHWWAGAGLVDGEVVGGGDFGTSLAADGRVLAGAVGAASDVTVASAAGFDDGAWHHVVFTRTRASGVLQLYVDGLLQGTAVASTGSLTASPRLTVGRIQTNRNTLDGRVDEVAVYPSVLPGARVTAHRAAAADPGDAYRSAVLADGPAGYWRLGETTGTVAADEVDANDGTYQKVPRPVAGAIADGDLAMVFVPAHVTVPRLVQDDFSIELWFSSTSGAGSGPHWWTGAGLVDGDVFGEYRDFGTSLSADGRVLAGAGDGSTDVTVSSTPGFNDGAWHHVVFTRTRANGVLELYVDGLSAGTAVGGTGPLDDPSHLTIGWIANGSYHLEGSIDEVAVYAVVLSPQVVAAHFQRGSP